MSTFRFSRRQFVTGVGATVAAPYIIPVSALGKGRPAPSARIQLGMIGFGTMAGDNIGNFLNNDKVQVVSVADPVAETGCYGYNADPNRKGGRNAGKRIVDEFYAKKLNQPNYKACTPYIDFREMLAKEKLDAVLISTPDHWHALHAVSAASKGIHVYGQKPMSYCIAEGRYMADTMKANQVTFQVGSQQRSDNYFRMACEFIRNGVIGKLEKIEVGLPGGHFRWNKTDVDYSQEPAPVPEWMTDFNLWIGPSQKRPYIPALHRNMTWRNNLDYSGGAITDWGAHHLDIVQWALGKDDSGPIAIENLKSDMPSRDKVFNTAAHYSFEVVYEEGTRVFVSDKFPNGITFYGEGGKKIFVTRGKLETTPSELIRTKLDDKAVKLYKSARHEGNFIDCIYSGEPTICTCEIGHRSITIAHLANIALRLGRNKVQWNPKTECFVNDAEADKLKTSPMFNGWVLKA